MSSKRIPIVLLLVLALILPFASSLVEEFQITRIGQPQAQCPCYAGVVDTISVQNVGDIESVYTAYSENNVLSYAPDVFSLAPGESRSIEVFANFACMDFGQKEAITSIQTPFGVTRNITTSLTTRECAPFEATLTPPPALLCSGAYAQSTLWIENTNTHPETYTIVAQGSNTDYISITESLVTLNSGESHPITVYLFRDSNFEGVLDAFLTISAQRSGYSTTVPLEVEYEVCQSILTMEIVGPTELCPLESGSVTVTVENSGNLPATNLGLTVFGPEFVGQNTVDNFNLEVGEQKEFRTGIEPSSRTSPGRYGIASLLTSGGVAIDQKETVITVPPTSTCLPQALSAKAKTALFLIIMILLAIVAVIAIYAAYFRDTPLFPKEEKKEETKVEKQEEIVKKAVPTPAPLLIPEKEEKKDFRERLNEFFGIKPPQPPQKKRAAPKKKQKEEVVDPALMSAILKAIVFVVIFGILSAFIIFINKYIDVVGEVEETPLEPVPLSPAPGVLEGTAFWMYRDLVIGSFFITLIVLIVAILWWKKRKKRTSKKTSQAKKTKSLSSRFSSAQRRKLFGGILKIAAYILLALILLALLGRAGVFIWNYFTNEEAQVVEAEEITDEQGVSTGMILTIVLILIILLLLFYWRRKRSQKQSTQGMQPKLAQTGEKKRKFNWKIFWTVQAGVTAIMLCVFLAVLVSGILALLLAIVLGGAAWKLYHRGEGGRDQIWRNRQKESHIHLLWKLLAIVMIIAILTSLEFAAAGGIAPWTMALIALFLIGLCLVGLWWWKKRKEKKMEENLIAPKLQKSSTPNAKKESRAKTSAKKDTPSIQMPTEMPNLRWYLIAMLIIFMGGFLIAWFFVPWRDIAVILTLVIVLIILALYRWKVKKTQQEPTPKAYTSIFEEESATKESASSKKNAWIVGGVGILIIGIIVSIAFISPQFLQNYIDYILAPLLIIVIIAVAFAKRKSAE